MYDAGSLSDTSLLQRALGELRVVVKRSGCRTVLDELRQVGCLKARFPRNVVQGWIDIVMLNIGGGVAGGDRLNTTIELGTCAFATIAGQAAERFYRALSPDAPSRVSTRLSVGPEAFLEWLPQETILFDRCALHRRLEVDLAPGARFLGVETLVFGRAAMGEQVRQGWLRDLISIRRAGEPLLHDAVRLDGDIAGTLCRPAVGDGASVVSTVVYAGPDLNERLDLVRGSLQHSDAGASVWNGLLVVRILGADNASVRRTVVAVLDVLREARPLPRVWLC